MDIQHDGYPTWITLLVNSLKKNSRKRILITIVPKKILRLVLPYTSAQSLRLTTKINKLFKY